MRQAPSIGGSLELCYWAKSSGHNRLSCLSTEGLKRALISWLLCSVLRFLYLLALIQTTSITYGISKPLCKVWLETYQGALLIILSISNWNVWRILVLDGLLYPQSSILYVQMGRSITLYTVSLLSRDSFERAFISQPMFLSLSSSWHHLAFMCIFHISFLSRWSPRYFTNFLTGMGVLWKFTGGQVSHHLVNVTCADLVGFTLILHCSSQCWSRLRWCWSFSVVHTGSGSDDSMAVSSANVAMSVSCVVGTLAVYSK